MPIDDISRILLNDHGLRITDAMNEYIANQLNSSQEGEIPVIGGDARTGIPLRTMIPVESLRRALQKPSN